MASGLCTRAVIKLLLNVPEASIGVSVEPGVFRNFVQGQSRRYHQGEVELKRHPW